MIQIQDDFNPQSSAVSSTPSAASTPTKDPKQDIDALLAQIEALSKQLEQEKQNTAVQPTASVTPVIPEAPEPVAAPAASASQDEDLSKFDLDTFLQDLEKRIQEDEAKAKQANVSNVNEDDSDFRKNRPSLNLDDQAVAEPAAQEKSYADELLVDDDSQVAAPAESASMTQDSATDEEALPAQNIFEMLGLSNISDEEKNQFLDELEEMIWNDFIEHDLQLLLTSTEYEEAKKILQATYQSEDARKEALLNYLSSLIPDLEEILYQKALELKAEMFAERIKRMSMDADESMRAKLQEVETLVAQNRFKSALKLLV
jgi:hypothetical protein